MGRNNKATLPFNLRHLYQGGFYKSWVNMKSRCSNPNVRAYPRYGGRGITFTASWDKFIGFYNDMYPSYIEGLTLERSTLAQRLYVYKWPVDKVLGG